MFNVVNPISDSFTLISGNSHLWLRIKDNSGNLHDMWVVANDEHGIKIVVKESDAEFFSVHFPLYRVEFRQIYDNCEDQYSQDESTYEYRCYLPVRFSKIWRYLYEQYFNSGIKALAWYNNTTMSWEHEFPDRV